MKTINSCLIGCFGTLLLYLFSTSVVLAQMSIETGDSLRQAGAFHAAEGFYRKALQQPLESAQHTDVLIRIGIIKKKIRQYDSAITYYRKADTLVSMQNLPELYHSKIYNNLANVFLNQGKLVNAITYYNKSLDIARQLNDTSRICNRLNNMGIAYTDLGMYQHAIDCYTEAIEMLSGTDDVDELGDLYNSMALLLKENEKYDEALSYHMDAIKIYNSLDDIYGVASQLNNIGELYLNKNVLDSAANYLAQSLELKRQIDDKTYAATTLVNFANLALKRAQYDSAGFFLSEAHHLFKEGNYPFGLAHTHLHYGQLLMELNEHVQAKVHLDSALIIATELKDIDLTYLIYEQLILLHRETGSYERALIYADKYYKLKDSLITNEKIRVTEWNEALARKEIEQDKTIAEQNAILTAKENRQLKFVMLTIAGLAIMSVVFGAVFWKQRKMIRHQYDELQKVNEIVEMQKADIRHQTKNSLQRVKNILYQLRRNTENSNNAIELEKAENMIMAVTALEEHLFDKPADKSIKMKFFLDDLKNKLMFSHSLEHQNIKINVNAVDVTLSVNTAIPLALIIAESVTNAVKYAFVEVNEPTIDIELNYDHNRFKLKIRDNGYSNKLKNGIFEGKGFGSTIIQGYLKQLNGTMDEAVEDGFCRMIYFKNS